MFTVNGYVEKLKQRSLSYLSALREGEACGWNDEMLQKVFSLKTEQEFLKLNLLSLKLTMLHLLADI